MSHLLFADDCFLLFKAETNQTQIMKDILTTYEEALGKTISLPKFEIYCSWNLLDSMKLTINNILGVEYVLTHEMPIPTYVTSIF